uniref:single-stranded DNA-binding protein 4 n=1 Tax=Lonchura striata TaxID=40157 RepID=UPI000B4DEC99|nr:single-stranded DNA-binding protein 4 [Lonchura striata domestica]
MCPPGIATSWGTGSCGNTGTRDDLPGLRHPRGHRQPGCPFPDRAVPRGTGTRDDPAGPCRPPGYRGRTVPALSWAVPPVPAILRGTGTRGGPPGHCHPPGHRDYRQPGPQHPSGHREPSPAVPSPGAAPEMAPGLPLLRCRLALYVYEYLLHVGAQKSAQTFLSEIRWEKNITLGEPPGFLHSWWCCGGGAEPEKRRIPSPAGGERGRGPPARAPPAPGGLGAPGTPVLSRVSPQSAAAAPSPVMGSLPPGDGMPGGIDLGELGSLLAALPAQDAARRAWALRRHILEFQESFSVMERTEPLKSELNPQTPLTPQTPPLPPLMSPRYPGGPRPPLRMPSQPPVGVPGSQPLLPNAMDPAARSQGHPGMGGPMQRMNPPRGMAGMGPQSYGSGMRPPPSSLAGPGMPTMNMGPGGRGPWPNPNANSIAYSSSSPGNYVGPPGGGGPPGTPILPSPGDSTNSSENMYTMMNPIGPAGNRPNFPMGPGPEGPMGGMGAMEPHHMNGSLGSGDMDGLPKVSWGPRHPHGAGTPIFGVPPCPGTFI